ncbi:MAG: hypothetical protein PHE93_06495 [Clostridia bacterium]|nr:hypothetical protein [Clostridia bacterium]
MLLLTAKEVEAFERCKAAGLLAQNRPIPATETDYQQMLAEMGFLQCKKIAYRSKSGKLKFTILAGFDLPLSSEKKKMYAYTNPDVLTILPIETDDFEKTMSLEAWYCFFKQGIALLNIHEFNSRMTTQKGMTFEELEKGFSLKYTSENKQTASRKQLDVLAEMILSGRLSPIPQREWENLTRARATELISSVPAPQKSKKSVSPKVKKIMTLYKDLSQEEKIELIEKLKTEG